MRHGMVWLRSWPLVLMGTLACAGKGANLAPAPVFYPPPPDTPRVQFLTFITSEADLGRRRSVLDRVVGASDQQKVIAKPYGLALHGGKIYVCDQDIFGVDVLDLPKREITFFQPKDPHAMRRATNCFVDGDGTLYVADTGTKQVLVYDSAGAFVARFGTEDDGNPVDVFVAGDRIYVSHLAGTHKIRVYDRRTRQPLFGFPDVPAEDSAGLAAPTNLFVTGDRVYASDMLKAQVLVYTTDGTWTQTIGRPGLGPSTFQRPKGIAVARDSLIYVVDGGFDNVQVFGADGRLRMFFGGPGEQPGAMVLPVKVVIDYEHLDYFRQYVAPGYDLEYLILVTNQFGPWKINVYGFLRPLASGAQ